MCERASASFHQVNSGNEKRRLNSYVRNSTTTSSDALPGRKTSGFISNCSDQSDDDDNWNQSTVLLSSRVFFFFNIQRCHAQQTNPCQSNCSLSIELQGDAAAAARNLIKTKSLHPLFGFLARSLAYQQLSNRIGGYWFARRITIWNRI